MVGGADASGFAGSAGWVGAGDDFAPQGVAADDFIAEIPGGDAAGEDDFVENVEFVVYFDGADGAEGVNVEVEAEN